MIRIWHAGLIVFLSLTVAVFAARTIGPPDDPFDASLLRDSPAQATSQAAADTSVSIGIENASFPLIEINVDVLDEFGVPIGGLTADDFCVSENGEPVFFEVTPVEELGCPTSICLVMDVSGSMDGAAIEAARTAARSFVNEMGPYDRVAVVSFSDCVTIDADFTSDKEILLAAIDSLSATGLTASFDGIYEGARLAADQPGDRAVIAFSDGCDNNSALCPIEPDGWTDDEGYTDDSTLICDLANSAGVSLYTLTFGPVESTCLAPMAAFAAGTGGYYRHAPDASVIDSLYRSVRTSLCSRYRISYRSPDTVSDGTRHTVEVCLNADECIRCDTAVYSEPAPPIAVRTDETIQLSESCQPQNEDISISIEVLNTDDQPVTAAELFYRPIGDGESPFVSVPMSGSGAGGFAAQIPSASLPPPTYGLEYFVNISNEAADVTLPPTNPYQYPFVITFCPNAGPEIREVAPICQTGADAVIQALIVDTLDFVDRVTLFYRPADGILFDSTVMIPTTDIQYQGSVPAAEAAGLFEVIIRATDNFGLTTSEGPLAFECDSLPPDTVIPTDRWIIAQCGNPSLGGQPLFAGNIVTAYDPDGVLCGRSAVDSGGKFGPMRIYADDAGTFLIDEGAVAGDTISFAVDGQSVTVTPTVVWSEHLDTVEVCDLLPCQPFALSPGWHLVSWNRAFAEDVDSLVSLLGGPDCVEVVLGFDGGGEVYDPHLPVFSTLERVNFYHGYWVNLTCDAEFAICGDSILAAEAIPLRPGWNLVSYWPDSALPIETAWGSVIGDVEGALGFDNVGSVWLPGDTIHNSLVELSPGLGYWLKSATDTILLYPGWLGPILQQPIAAKGQAEPSLQSTRLWISMYSQNLTVDGVPVPNGTVIDAVSPQGEVCGRGVYRNGKLSFTPIYGSDSYASAPYPRHGDSVQLRVDGEAVYPKLVYSSHGDRVEVGPLVTDADVAQSVPKTFRLAQNFPNPFNPSTTVEFALPRAGEISVKVYNLLGREVVTLAKGYRQAGVHQVLWNGRDGSGNPVGSGVYLYRLSTDNGDITRKMLLVK